MDNSGEKQIDLKIDLYLGGVNEVYFKEEGVFIVDKVFLVANHPTDDKGLVAIIKAHHKEKTTYRIEATSDKFHF